MNDLYVKVIHENLWGKIIEQDRSTDINSVDYGAFGVRPVINIKL